MSMRTMIKAVKEGGLYGVLGGLSAAAAAAAVSRDGMGKTIAKVQKSELAASEALLRQKFKEMTPEQRDVLLRRLRDPELWAWLEGKGPPPTTVAERENADASTRGGDGDEGTHKGDVDDQFRQGE